MVSTAPTGARSASGCAAKGSVPLRGATKLNYAGTGTLTLNGNNTTIGATTVSSARLW